jgi:acetylglutamate kinase
MSVNDAYQKAAILVEALGWIRQFRDRLVVIKLGGSALEDEATVRRLLNDVIFMEAVGMHPVLIHGGGKSINAAMKTAGIEPRWVQGRRYTDEDTLEIVSQVLAGEICVSLCQVIRSLEGRAMPLSFLSCNVLIGERLMLPVDDGPAIDLGFVGQVTDIDGALIRQT